jgi:type IV secretion system protein VirD4
MLLCSRILAFFHSSQSLHTAHFARLHDLEDLLSATFAAPSLLLGSSRFSQLLRVAPTQTRRELGNLLVVAPTRGGKGLLAISQLLTWPHSVIVNDVKGELFRTTAGYRATLGPVYVIDPTGIGHQFDPLHGKQTEDEFLSAATQLLYKPDEADGLIFTQRAAVMLTQLFLAAREEGMPPFLYVRELIQLGLPDVAARLDTINPKLAANLLDVRTSHANFTDRFLLSAWSTLTARMRPLLTQTVVRSLAGSDFTAQDIMAADQPVTVYLRWKEQDLLALSPLVRLIWGTLLDGLITAYDKAAGKNCQPVLVLIDEAGRTAIPSLAEHATTVVGRGISLWIAIQDLNQLAAVYGRERAHVLRNNMDSQLYYRPNDQDTAKYLEDCLGRKSDYAHSETLREGTAPTEGRSEQGIPLLTAWEIKQLPDEDILGFHRRLPPFKATRMDWRHHPVLVKRSTLQPPTLSPLPVLDDTLPMLLLDIADDLSGYIDPDLIGVDPDAIGDAGDGIVEPDETEHT